MLWIFNIFAFSVIGAFAGKFMAMTAYYLPQILLEGCDKGREPRDIIVWFFQKPHCWHCLHSYTRKENAPIIGYWLMKGICPYCHVRLEKKICILEVGMALLFGLSAFFFTASWPLVYILVVSAFLILCFITDFEYGILPDQLTLGLLWVALIGSLVPVFIPPQEAIIGAITGYGFFWVFNVVYRYFRGFEGMYPGDFKLNAAIGSIVGIKLLLPVMIFSLLSLVIIAVVQALSKAGKHTRGKFLHKEIPYACFASVVTFAVLVWLAAQSVELNSILQSGSGLPKT